MPAYKDFDEERIKHLELIQAVVARLGTNGFLIKGWALTVAGVFLGFALERGNVFLVLASVGLTIVFWGLDAYFLRSERLFRELYRRVRVLDKDIPPFFMSATDPKFAKESAERVPSFWTTMLARPALAWLYGAILVGSVVVALAIVLTGSGSGTALPSPSPT